jgi:hypothetical protein
MSNQSVEQTSQVGSFSTSQPQVAAASAAAPAATSATTGKAGGTTGGGLSDSTTISSMEDLRTKAPQIYKMMMQSIAMDICIQMQQAQDRLSSMSQGNS